jgi:hypothetical protein
MIELLVFGLLILILPLMLLGLLLKLVLFAVSLPFRVIGLAFKLVFGIFGLVFKVLFSAAGLVGALVACFVVVMMLPLLPLLLVGAGLWLMTRPLRPCPV